MCLKADTPAANPNEALAPEPGTQDSDFTVIWAAPILPGKSEAWRRFIQEMIGDRREGYKDACSRLRIRAARAWMTETAKGDVGVIAVIAVQPEQIIARLAASDLPFDHWFRTQLAALQGVDISLPPHMPPSEMVLDWQGDMVGKEVEDKVRNVKGKT